MSLYSNQHYLFANWKMYLDYDESNILANALAAEAAKFPPGVKMAVFPSVLSFYPVARVLKDAGIAVGAQNAHWVDRGGYTGEVSAEMFKNAGAEYILIGHSERRHLFHESNHEVRQKMEAALAAGLTPVLCVGETEKERQAGQMDEAVEIQLRAALEGLRRPEGRALVIAYEPVWAIGTGHNCDPLEAEKMQNKISVWTRDLAPDIVAPILLYGGSVRPNNAAEYLKQPHIHGILVGSSSTKLDIWLDIVHNAVA